jgi:hypothetical protein
METPKFSLGRVVMTRGVAEWSYAADATGVVLEAVRRHGLGDWGDVCDEDRGENDRALEAGNRLLSVYKFGEDCTLWIITEWDRSVTTVLFPEDY